MAKYQRNLTGNAAMKEGIQPDPALQTARRIQPAWLSLLGIVIVLILAIVFYGLNEPITSSEMTSDAGSAVSTVPNPVAPASTPGAPAPAKNGNG